MKTFFKPVTLAILTLSLFACQKSDFVYYATKPVAGKFYNFKHQLKDIQGESAVDIIWVIDNSGSMGSHQRELGANAQSFMSNFIQAKLDWKIGILTTDVRNKPALGFEPGNEFDARTPDPVRKFQQAVVGLGIMGDAIERGFAPVRDKLAAYPNFPRKNAVLAIIFVTDAPDQSQMRSFGGSASPPIDAPELLQIVTKLKGGKNRVVSYGVFASLEFGCQQTDGFGNYAGSRYEQFIKPLNGKVYSLCDRNFGANLASMGQDLLKRVRNPRINLDSRPIMNTLKVLYLDKPLPGGDKAEGGYWFYDFDLNSIVFHDLDFAAGDTEQVRVVFDQAT